MEVRPKLTLSSKCRNFEETGIKHSSNWRLSKGLVLLKPTQRLTKFKESPVLLEIKTPTETSSGKAIIGSFILKKYKSKRLKSDFKISHLKIFREIKEARESIKDKDFMTKIKLKCS